MGKPAVTNELKPGMPAPAFKLDDVYGKTVSLPGGRSLLLVFIRHLGSLHCRAHLSQIRQQYGRIQHAGGEVIVISFAAPEALQRLIQAHKLPFTMLTDPERKVYRQYGMLYRDTGPVQTWKTLSTYVKLRLAGYPKPLRGGDPRQMGGNVVIDPSGIIRFLHRSQFPEDRPTAADVVQTLTGLDR